VHDGKEILTENKTPTQAKLYILVTVHLGIILINNQLDTQFPLYIYLFRLSINIYNIYMSQVGYSLELEPTRGHHLDPLTQSGRLETFLVLVQITFPLHTRNPAQLHASRASVLSPSAR
jgi:hypothetical protein